MFGRQAQSPSGVPLTADAGAGGSALELAGDLVAADRNMTDRRAVINDPDWYENEYGYWIGYANHPAGELTSRGAPFEDDEQRDRLAERDDS
jgi:hypothetical protein